METVRGAVPPLVEDRYMADDLARAADLVRDGHVSGVCGVRDLLAGGT
jgi:histidine ammonia-lyase